MMSSRFMCHAFPSQTVKPPGDTRWVYHNTKCVPTMRWTLTHRYGYLSISTNQRTTDQNPDSTWVHLQRA